MGLFGKKRKEAPPDDGIVVLKKTAPGTCGGTDAFQDTKAPKTIVSTEMILFDAESALTPPLSPSREFDAGGKPCFFSAFAAPAERGTFIFLSTSQGFRSRDRRSDAWALTDDPVFPALVAIVNEFGLAKRNGYHSMTHGLPENFGGYVDIRYGSGERIGLSDNQSPVVSFEAGQAIVSAFSRALGGKRVPLPDASDLREIRFLEDRGESGYTRAVLTVLPDGCGINKKVAKYSGPEVYESEKAVDAETVGAIKESINRSGILAWSGLPENGFRTGRNKKMVFVFEGGREITVTDGKILPSRLSGGFFEIELEMTTKH